MVANWISEKGSTSMSREGEPLAVSRGLLFVNPGVALQDELHATLEHTGALQRGVKGLEGRVEELRFLLKASLTREAKNEADLSTLREELGERRERALSAEREAREAIYSESMATSRDEVVRLMAVSLLRETLLDISGVSGVGSLPSRHGNHCNPTSMTGAEARGERMERGIRLAIEILGTQAHDGGGDDDAVKAPRLSVSSVGAAAVASPCSRHRAGFGLIDFSQSLTDSVLVDESLQARRGRKKGLESSIIISPTWGSSRSIARPSSMIEESLIAPPSPPSPDPSLGRLVEAGSIPDELAAIEAHLIALMGVGAVGEPG